MSIIDPVRTRVDLATLNLGFGVFPNVQPFSPRTAVGYQDLLEGLYRYVTRDIFTYLTAASGQATWDANIDTLLAAIDTALAQQKSDIDTETAAALQAVIDSTIAISDPVTLAIINDPTTATSVKLAALFGLTDQKVKDALGPVTYGVLDARYVQPATADRNAITGWFHVDEFGAVGDGTTHDEAAIQSAIDTAHAAYLTTGTVQRVFFGPRVYLVAPTITANPVAGLTLRDGVELYGQGTVKVAPGSYWIGTDYALLRSPDAGLTNAGIRELTFDGNKAAFSVPGGNNQASNIVLRTSKGVWIRDVTSHDSAGMGIMVAGHTDNPSDDVLIEGCTVYNCDNLGIQVSQFANLRILRNKISWVTGNAIDIYGEPENHIGDSSGVNFVIAENLIYNCGTGIFPETVAIGTIEANQIRNCSEGIHINRINAQPNRINVVNNLIIGTVSAIHCTGEAASITIRGNQLEQFNTAGVYFGGPGNTPGDSGNIAGYYVLDNTMNGNTDQTPLVLFGSGLGQIVNMLILRTVTNSKHREFDTINSGPGAVNSTWGPATSPGD